MFESFVDLSYRGLALGRRIKLTQVRPTTGYLEVPMPMPVGTAIAIATDDGVTLAATVLEIFEQIGGSDRPPGMTVQPALADAAAAAWWQARVALPEITAASAEAPSAPSEPRGRPVTVRPRSHTIPAPPPQPPPNDAKQTKVMDAVDQEMLAQLTSSEGVVEALVSTTGEHAVVDDGKRTVAMDAVDLTALGLDASASGGLPAVPAPSDDDASGARASASTPPTGVKKRKKKR